MSSLDPEPGCRDWPRLVDRHDVLLLDTETTGLKTWDEILDIALLDTAGTTVLQSLVLPRGPVPRSATHLHGWTRDRLQQAGAPTWPEIRSTVTEAMGAASLVIGWNLAFDLRLVGQSCLEWGLFPLQPSPRWRCLMLDYAAHRGEPRPAGLPGYRWHSLQAAARHELNPPPPQRHGALADVRLTLEVLRAVSGSLSARKRAPHCAENPRIH